KYLRYGDVQPLLRHVREHSVSFLSRFLNARCIPLKLKINIEKVIFFDGLLCGKSSRIARIEFERFRSTLQQTLQVFIVFVKDRIFLTQALYFLAGMHDGTVITAAKGHANFWKTVTGQLTRQPHRQLTWTGINSGTFRPDNLFQGNAEIFTDHSLNIFRTDGPGTNRQYIF